ncbi:hypothetical protein H696_03910 [Fonticula alba]|uniref:Dynamin GTPase n=1 Tax=Fonticula alba TaxID=691883 RepID=A0A058Z6G3_FONAL|nr:hypothetical protein H696_03910 [Fonticula alba]KCV69483.1 hypothetical protein H696_03910 [Fonticula alba]|eukprot:XP_009496048.1 hypothetical protein H696_03910 [Fonticula alba]
MLRRSPLSTGGAALGEGVFSPPRHLRPPGSLSPPAPPSASQASPEASMSFAPHHLSPRPGAMSPGPSSATPLSLTQVEELRQAASLAAYHLPDQSPMPVMNHRLIELIARLEQILQLTTSSEPGSSAGTGTGTGSGTGSGGGAGTATDTRFGSDPTGVELSAISLPRIVVVGSQSTGKSSVLEAIVGRDLLPRGRDIVTRCPLVLQLRHVPPSDRSQEERAIFSHAPMRLYRPHEYPEVIKEIEAETRRITRGTHSLSSKPIYLTVCAPRLVNLTLVDLPGLTKIAVGDQPTDIEQQSRNMALDFISQPSTLILAVSAANVDIANSEALNLARQVDPTGERTIGLLTKVDLMEVGSDALPILRGETVPLRLGFVPVVNRSQQDIQNGLAIGASISRERVFFSDHPSYRGLRDVCGTPFLAAYLSKLLEHSIRNQLPKIEDEILQHVAILQERLRRAGSLSPVPSDPLEQSQLLLSLLSDFSQSVSNAINGYVDASTRHAGPAASEEVTAVDSFLESHAPRASMLHGGSRLFDLFQNRFPEHMLAIDPCQGLSDAEIHSTLLNSSGMRARLGLTCDAAFEHLVKRQIPLLLGPSLRCLDTAFEELWHIVGKSSRMQLGRFPRLEVQALRTTRDIMTQGLGPARTFIQSLVDIECSFINISHPDFVAFKTSMRRAEMTRWTEPSVEGSLLSSSIGANGPGMVDLAEPISPTPVGKTIGRGLANYLWRGGVGGGAPSTPGGEPPGDMSSPGSGPGGGSVTIGPPSPPSLAESSYIGRTSPGLPPVGSVSPRSPFSSSEREDIGLLRQLVDGYVRLVRARLLDLVPKVVVHHLVRPFTGNTLHNSLIAQLHHPARGRSTGVSGEAASADSGHRTPLSHYLHEQPVVRAQRVRLASRLQASERALTAVRAFLYHGALPGEGDDLGNVRLAGGSAAAPLSPVGPGPESGPWARQPNPVASPREEEDEDLLFEDARPIVHRHIAQSPRTRATTTTAAAAAVAAVSGAATAEKDGPDVVDDDLFQSATKFRAPYSTPPVAAVPGQSPSSTGPTHTGPLSPIIGTISRMLWG